MSSYLAELTIRLAQGIEKIPLEARDRHTAFLLSKQDDDGGFVGREGGSDLYYTGFALRSLGILGKLEGDVAQRAAEFLRSRLVGQESIVDFLSLIYGAMLLEMAAGLNVFSGADDAWRDSVAEAMAALRREDGGYAKAAAGKASSTYHTFLVLLCLEVIERPIERPDDIRRFLDSQRCEGGGFREIRVSKRAGTNPTAAAIGTLRILDGLTDEIKESTLDFLVEMQTDEGGIRANTRIPIADLLSTFTGLLTSSDLGGLHDFELPEIQKFASSLEQADGGYFGAVWDERCDVEYTFYGLGTQALLNMV